jgi:hypothetical protein
MFIHAQFGLNQVYGFLEKSILFIFANAHSYILKMSCGGTIIRYLNTF